MKKDVSPLVAVIIIVVVLLVIAGIYMVLMNPQRQYQMKMDYMSAPPPTSTNETPATTPSETQAPSETPEPSEGN